MTDKLKDDDDDFLWEENIPFENYILHCQERISKRRQDLTEKNKQLIIEINQPYDLVPKQETQVKVGALLIHGLFDCPFTLRDIADQLYQHEVHCRSLLLPGHGTAPQDLLHVSFKEWIRAVDYGIRSFKPKVDRLILIGYSTGATLSLLKANESQDVAGIILISPAVSLTLPVNVVMRWHAWLNRLRRLPDDKNWIARNLEKDYVKYQSICITPVRQIVSLTRLLKSQYKKQQLKTPMYMVLSRDDRTISAHAAIQLFLQQKDPRHKLLLYSGTEARYKDPRIEVRNAARPEMNICNYSHVSLPIAPNNKHYGPEGDYIFASKPKPQHLYGSFNKIEVNLYDKLYQHKVTTTVRRELTYNPDFPYMIEQLLQFIKDLTQP